MKHIQIKSILCAALAASVALPATAQEQQVELNDSLAAKDDGMVQVAFRSVAQEELLGGVSFIDMDELTKKNYNTYTLDNLQGYVGGWNGNSLWGMDEHLVLVDGIPRDVNNVQPSEIDQITFLKGASAVVLYGSRAAKGVILITTKRGKEEAFKVSVRGNTGFNVAKRYPDYLGSAEYMSLYNEALANDGLSPLYSQEEIYNYASGKNPYRYPNVNFYSSDYLKKAYNRSEVTAEMSGGNQRARFYTNISFYNTGDVFKFGEAKDNHTNRFSVRGNVDLTLSDFITAYVNANVSFYNSRTAKGDYWAAASTFRPNRVAPLIPISLVDQTASGTLETLYNSMNIVDGGYFLGGTQQDETNIFGDYYAAGYTKYTSRQFQFDTGVNIDMGKLLKGLSFRAQFAVDYATSYNTSYDNAYATYTPTWVSYNGTEMIGTVTKHGNDEKSGVQNVSGSASNQTIAFSGVFDYKTSVDNTHNIHAMLLASGYQQSYSGQYHKDSNANLGLQLSYNYQNRYYADFGAAVVHSAKYAPGHRQAFSPSLTLGWNLANESFLENSSVVDDMMLSVSGSILHTDLGFDGYYLWQGSYNQSNGQWWGWRENVSLHSTNIQRGENRDLTFAKRKEFSVNLRTSLWKKLVTLDASFFVNEMDGLFTDPESLYPSYFFAYFPENARFRPYVNYNSDRRMGFDFNATFNKRVGEVDLSLGLAGTYYTTKATKRSELFDDAYQYREGKAVDGVWGLQCEGFFESEEEIENSPEQIFGGEVKPGDLKYVDQNKDGVVDDKDVVYLGRGGWYGSPFTFGINLTAKWKNFTFFALGTGGVGGYAMKNSDYYWVSGADKYSEVVRGRWTEATKATATYPRLTTQAGNNNFRDSSFWMYKNNRFDLAKVQITYDFPSSLLKRTFIKGVSAYISGSNLLTISKERKLMELNTTSAPQTRFYNIGVKATF